MIKTRCNKSLYTLTKKEIIPPPKKSQYLLLVKNHLLKKETKTKISLKSPLHPFLSPQIYAMITSMICDAILTTRKSTITNTTK